MKKKQTVAIVLNTSWNIYNFRLGLLKALEKEGYRIVTIAPRDEYSQKLEALGYEYREIKINNSGTNPIEEIKLIYDFVKLYKEVKPDILLHYTIKPNVYGSIAADILDIPVITNISGLGTVFLTNSFPSKIAKFLYKVAMRIPKKVFFQNSDDRELFIAKKLVNPKITALLAGSGIDTEKFAPKKDAGPSGGPLRFLFIARLVKDKGIVEYVDAARLLKEKYPDVEFAILGAFYPGNPTAIRQEEMHRWVKEGAVRYLGVRDDVRSVIAAAACVVLPSYREGLSRVLLEASSMAKPIVTTDVPGCKDVVEDGINGFLCRAKDVKDLADTMEKMILLSEAKREEMGRRGREKAVGEFDEKIVIRHYIDAIKAQIGTDL